MSNISDAVASLNGCWTWYNDPRAIYSTTNNALYYGSIRTNGVITVDSWRFTPRLFHSGTPRTAVLMADDHCNPAIIELDNGKILAAYSEHAGGTSYSARSTAAGSIRNWDAAVTVGTNTTYANLMQMGDTAKTVFWFLRDDNDDRKQKYRTSTDRGDTWSSMTTFIAETSQRPYVKYHKTSGSRIDFCTTTGQPSETTNSIYHGYLNVASDGTVTAFKSDGTSVSLPARPSDFTLVYDGSSTNSWNWDIRDIGGTKVILFTSFASSNTVHTYWQARYSGGSWTTNQIATGGTTGTADYLYAAEPYYSGGITQDPNDINAVYLSREYGSGDFRVEKWTHSGTFGSGTWSKASDASGNTGTVNARPYAVDCNGTTRVLWWEGSYTEFIVYSTRIRVSPSFSWLKAKPASPSYSSTYAPSGVQAYYLCNEGSGTSLTDWTGNGYGGTFVSTPTWNAGAGDDYGAYLNGFDTSKYVTINGLATALNSNDTNYPVWIALLYKTTSAGTSQEFPVSFGRSSDNNPIVALQCNNGDQNQVAAFWRDDAGNTNTPSGTSTTHRNDGYNVLMLSKTGSAVNRVWLNGTALALDTNTGGGVTVDRGAIGCLLRGSAAAAFTGEVHAVLVGWGSLPDLYWLQLMLAQGQFSGLLGNEEASSTVYQSFYYRLLTGGIGG